MNAGADDALPAYGDTRVARDIAEIVARQAMEPDHTLIVRARR